MHSTSAKDLSTAVRRTLVVEYVHQEANKLVAHAVDSSLLFDTQTCRSAHCDFPGEIACDIFQEQTHGSSISTTAQ